MHGPDGSNYPNEARFLRIEESRGFVIGHILQPHFEHFIGFEQAAAGTIVTWEQTFERTEVVEYIKHIVGPSNEQNLSCWQTEIVFMKNA
jgi:hypothetical protein